MSEECLPFKIHLPGNLLVHSKISEASLDPHILRKRDMLNGYCWYDLNEQIIDNNKLLINLCFNQGLLECIHLSMSDDKYGTSWDDWSREKEELRAKETENFIKKLGFIPGEYLWGKILVVYDEYSSSGYCKIIYKLSNF